MKKITLTFLSLCFSIFLGHSQNLIVNGDFEVGASGDAVPSWSGYKNRIATDDILNTQIGQIENGDGSLFQVLAVTPGETYTVSLEYRWVGSAGTAGSDLTIRVKDADNLPFNLPLTGGTMADGFTLDSALDVWFTASFSFEVPAGITNVRFLMFKANGNKPLNVDNIVVEQTLSVSSLEKFDFTFYPNPAQDILHISANENISKIEIFNIMGKKVEEIKIGLSQTQVQLSNLNTGVYFMKTYIGNNVGTSKLIKK